MMLPPSRQFGLCFLLLFGMLRGAAPIASAETVDLEWKAIDAPPIEISGLPWQRENGGELRRFALRHKAEIPPAVWSLSASPSGGRIRFRTDSNRLVLRLEYPSAPNMANMHAYGQTGVDLYLDGLYWATAVADKEAKPGVRTERVIFQLDRQPRTDREITLYLPLYKPVKVLGIGIEAGARTAPPSRFAVAKPVVFYGTSITQGGCASRPGLSYPAMLGRKFNLDFVNLGFSGNGKGEPAVARAVAEIDAACFVLDFALNNPSVASVREVYEPFIATLREKHPTTPILAITPIFMPRERLVPENREADLMRVHIREVVGRRIAAGDRRLQLVEGTALMGPGDLEGFVDGAHPNDLGFHNMAERLAPHLAKAIGLSATR